MKHKLSALLLFSLLFATCSAFAQKYTGTILGTVVDSSGAMMPNVTVSARNVATDAVRTATTNGQGEYTIQDLAAGTYEVKASAPNFKEVVARNVELHVSSNATINLKLQPGGTTEVVSVEASALQVETSTGAVGNVVDGTQVRELPLNGRSFVQLTQLMPGVSPQGNFDSKHKGLEAGVDFSVNGNSTTGNIFLVDGVNNNDIGSNRTILVYPSIDSIQEFKMLRNSYGPEYGQAMGAVINIVTRGGSNSFHGNAFYFGRNDALNATDYFNNLNKIPKDKLRRNDWGYTFGGPIKKDKLFFFWSEEWNHELRGKARVGDVPTAAEKAGNFLNLRTDKDNNGNPCDPAPRLSSTSPILTNISQVPTGGVSKGGQTYLQMFPDPNVANPVNCKNWAQSVTAPIRWREENIRGDYNLGKTWTIFGRFTYDHWEQPFPNTQGFWGDDQYPSIESGWKQPGKQATVKLTKLFGNSAVNDFQVSYAANRITVSQSGTNPGLNDQIIAASPTYYPLSQKFNGNKIGYPGFWGGCGPDCATGDALWMQGPWHNNEQLLIAKDDFSKVMGNHTFKVGFLVTNNQKNEMVENESQENAFYWGAASNNTGNGAFNMLWNQVQWGGSENQTNPFSQIRWHDVEPYFGDTWKMRPNLTVEYGFRWSFLRMPYSGPDRIATFSPSAYNPALGSDPCNGLLLPPGTNFCQAAGFKGGVAGVNRALKDNNNHAIAPRFGVAWDPWGDGKTAFRAGVGQFFQRERLNNTLQMATNPPFSLSASFSRALDVAPAQGTLTASGSPAFAQSTSDILPNTWQWNLTVEHQFTLGSKLELAYVGNRGIHLLQYSDANPVAASQRLNFATQNDNHIRPFGNGNFGFITDAFWGGDSNYHALQALYRQKVKAIDAQFAYTWSKSLTNTDVTNSGNNNRASLLLDPANPRLNYGPSQINRPHVFTGNVVYNAPQLSNYNSLIHNALGGWELASILQYTSGSSMTAFAGRTADGAPGGISGSGANQDNARPLVVPGQGCRAPSGSPKYQWLNPNRWTMVGYQIGTFGNGSIGDCLTPGFANTDFSVYKNFKVMERVTMQFRMEFFNVFNKTQFLGNYQDTANINAVLSNSVLACTSTSASDSHGINNPASACFNRPINTTVWDAANTRNPNFGAATKDRGPREIQYGLKLTF